MSAPGPPCAPVVSWVVLNWGAEATTRECVASIDAQSAAIEREVIVVDNESTPTSRRGLRDCGARVVALRGNRGFTGGMNAGAYRARGELVVLLNNDTRLPEGWLERALTAMRDPAVAIVGGPTTGEDGGSTLPRVDPVGFVHLTSILQPRREVASVDGSHMLVRASAWRELGGFDDDFFAYGEDADLCARAMARGWSILYEPSLEVWHRRGLSSDRVRWRRSFWSRRNRLLWIAKHFPEDRWRALVGDATMEYLAQAVTGQGVPAGSPMARLSTRSAALVVVLWAIIHRRWLATKRDLVILAGEHDEGYQGRLRAMYEPAPFGRHGDVWERP